MSVAVSVCFAFKQRTYSRGWEELLSGCFKTSFVTGQLKVGWAEVMVRRLPGLY